MPFSFEQIREMVRNALEVAHSITQGAWIYIVDQYDDEVVYEIEGQGTGDGPLYYRRSYAIVDDDIQLGEPTRVERKVEYVQVEASLVLVAAADAEAGRGEKWRVQVVEFGEDLNRNWWDQAVLTAHLSHFEGAQVFCLTEAQHQARPHPFGKSVKDLVGWLENVEATKQGIEADLVLTRAAAWLGETVLDAWERGKKDLVGLSVDITGTVGEKTIRGKSMPTLTAIRNVTVDVVYDPAAGGKFLRMAAARGLNQEESEMKEKLLAALKKSRPEEYAKIDPETITEDELIKLLAAAAVDDAGGGDDSEKLVAAVVAGLKEVLSAGEGDDGAIKEVKLLAAGLVLDRELSASNLPEIVQAKLRKRFENRTFETEALQAAIKEEKEVLDQLMGSGEVTGAGDVRVTRDSTEKLQAAVDKLFAVQVGDAFADVPGFTGLRAAYVEMTGDTEVRGYLDPGQVQRLQAAYSTATFAYVLGNTLYRRMVQDYREISDYGVSRLVGGNIRNARDFRTLESVRIGYYGDLPDVTPETVDYPDLGELSDERVEYALNQKGGIITITRKMVINDDMRAVTKIISRLPRAARRTLAKRCWNKFIGNATYKGDALAVFHASHGNLGSAAYGIASALAAKTAMSQQAEPDSGERLMLRPVTVAFPSELFGIVKNVNDFNPQAVAIAEGNSMFGYFKPEGLVECPFMTDANDWMMFADPNEVEILELAYLNGQQEPEMFVADNPAVGQMFVGDKVQYKIRHEYETEVVDYRGAYKSVVV